MNRDHPVLRLLTSQLAVSACLAVLLAWGAATSACVPVMFEALEPRSWLDAMTLSALMGLYLAMLLFFVALGACVLGCLPLYLLAQLARWMLPAGWRSAVWLLYLCPVMAYAMATQWLPVWGDHGAGFIWLGGLFAAIPTIVLVAFHLWVVAPTSQAPVGALVEAADDLDGGMRLAMLEGPSAMLNEHSVVT